MNLRSPSPDVNGVSRPSIMPGLPAAEMRPVFLYGKAKEESAAAAMTCLTKNIKKYKIKEKV